MIPAWASLTERDQSTFQATVAFLESRMSRSDTIEWALRLKPSQKVERLAIGDLLNGPRGQSLQEPWVTAWQLIEESWVAAPAAQQSEAMAYAVGERLRRGERSGSIIAKIVCLVTPRLEVKPIESWRWELLPKRRRPKTFEDLLTARLTSGELLDLRVLKIREVNDVDFLRSLVYELESAVRYGLETAQRLGWRDQEQLWQIGDLSRVYYVESSELVGADSDPDSYNRGIAPSVKLLFSIFERIGELDRQQALQCVGRWGLGGSVVHTRLWAAAARDPDLVASERVAMFLLGLNDNEFWSLDTYPEIAELRALRFNGLSKEPQREIVRRIKRGPPRNLWPSKASSSRVSAARRYWAARELKRVIVAGGVLPEKEKGWLAARGNEFHLLKKMDLYHDFPRVVEAYSLPSNPDSKYDALSGQARLRALEAALLSSRGGWNDDPAERANDWLRREGNTLLVLVDLEAGAGGAERFPRVLDRFGWAHRPGKTGEPTSIGRDLQSEADRVLGLLSQMSQSTLAGAIRGVSAWLDAWRVHVSSSTLFLPVWLHVWPVAVDATNVERVEASQDDLDAVVLSEERSAPHEIDTLNSPAGKLVGVFLASCPSLESDAAPFRVGVPTRDIRDQIVRAVGRSGVIGRHRLIEHLPYFLRADRVWTEQHLIAPLLKDSSEALSLWNAIARRVHFGEILSIIGGPMSERATDRRLSRSVREALVFSLVVESLHALRENRASAVPKARVQQMLRSLDDEVRASAAKVVQRFIRDLSSAHPEQGEVPSAAELFKCAGDPFVREVWPQERSLASPGVSRAFAELPATAGGAFVDAVAAVDRFLVPFDCWSMSDYGLRGEVGGERNLTMIDSGVKAKAFLRLLDLTVGSSERAVVPHDLTEALDRIRHVASELTRDPVYRRLSTAARR